MAGNLLLDLFCGAGGATRGYQDAGFRVVGVDHKPQPHYVGDDFIQADALEFLAGNYWKFDAVHASPPCQRYSKMTRCRPGLAEEYPDYVRQLAAWLDFYDKPYVIENVPEAPLRNPLILCGTMFGLELYRHRGFECNFRTKRPKHPFHHKSAVHPDNWKPGLIMSVVGNCAPIEHARTIMQCPWMSRDELAEAVPPAFTAYIGDFLRRRLDRLARP